MSFSVGLHEIGDGIYAYLQPDGSWGWSNAGLVVGSRQTLLIDTLFDRPLTARMLDHMRDATSAAEQIDLVVNTHANGDHCYGNELVTGAQIIASRACAAEMRETPPSQLARMMASTHRMGNTGGYLREIFGAFQFDGISLTPPTRVFDGEMSLDLGGRHAVLMEVGPAHTQGDVMVYLPEDRILFAGDILFNEGHPIVWAGPVSNWIATCERVLDMSVDTIVPGHGPIAGKESIASLKEYFEYVRDEARLRFDAGMPAFQAAREIRLDRYKSWGDSERIVVNVVALYRDFGLDPDADVIALFGEMATFPRG